MLSGLGDGLEASQDEGLVRAGPGGHFSVWFLTCFQTVFVQASGNVKPKIPKTTMPFHLFAFLGAINFSSIPQERFSVKGKNHWRRVWRRNQLNRKGRGKSLGELSGLTAVHVVKRVLFPHD